MLFKTDVALLALARLGSSFTITSLDTDNSNQAKVIRRHFKMSLYTTLGKFNWNFARGFGELALLEEDPTPSWPYSYSMPANALEVRRIASDGYFPNVQEYEEDKAKWVKVFSASGPVLYTNVPRAHAEYTVKLDENLGFPVYFAKSLSAQLALDIAPAIITNTFAKVQAQLEKGARIALSEGISEDLNSQPAPTPSHSPYLSARFK